MNKKVDPILLEVIKNGFDTIADEIALIMLRTAYSAIVRDAMDFSTAIWDIMRINVRVPESMLGDLHA